MCLVFEVANLIGVMPACIWVFRLCLRLLLTCLVPPRPQIEQEENMINQHVPEITTEEVRRAAKRMKNGKAAGPGGLQIELIKNAPTIVYEIIARIFNKCLQGRQSHRSGKKHISHLYIRKGTEGNVKTTEALV